MGNCCKQTGEKNFSSIQLNDLLQRKSLLLEQLQQLQNPVYNQTSLQIKMITWIKDSHDLFDYENTNRIAQSLTINSSIKLYRDKSSGKIQSTQQGKTLIRIENRQNCFWIEPRQAKNDDHHVWLVIKSISQQENGVKLQYNDVIRVGKVEIKLKETSFRYERETILSQSVDDQRCRICLLGSESIDDPKIEPCNCSGTMALIHLKCLQHWIVTKYNMESSNAIVFLWDLMKCELCRSNFKRKLQLNGQTVDLVELSKRQFQSYAVLEMKKPLLKSKERLTYILNLEKLEQFKIGRANDNHIRLCDISVSRFHCKLTLHNKEFYIQDNNSKFGTLLKLKQSMPLLKEFQNVQVQVGRTLFEFENVSNGYQ
ncbi:unnamed protein product (macronuclear) [Paramecium tetraurelia]|uniref:FHA domain-containing protein n=2 Tax=Paramecium tetraurelia TaxID=5888 RepID=A0D022_PARTE|nr:uncharacterized protein GSPATT00039137001 [Paramecium tetraurelia]CAK76389.1 unnamed protein product [Paramecium tetraurelia]|eukprot:XP_001443786.1 hypothetical protein (macronuclear) [Paramecium tetraurelia strain d4-2]